MRAERSARREVVSTLRVELMCRYMSFADHMYSISAWIPWETVNITVDRAFASLVARIPLRLLRSRKDVASCRLGCVGLFVAGDFA